MKLYLVKSDVVKARYFFQDEEKATALYEALREDDENVVLKYLTTSDEWEIEHLSQHFNMLKGNL